MNFASSSHGGEGKQDGQKDPEHLDCVNHDKDEDEKSSSEADQQKEEDMLRLCHQ